MRIVIVEDNKSVANGIAYVLRDAGHAVDLIFDGAAADEFLRDDGADVIILDFNLPQLSGIEVLKGLRARGDQRPVLMLTARTTLEDKLAGLNSGADDYLAKPFEMAELTARLQVLMRRAVAKPVPTHSVGPLTFDLAARQVVSTDGPLELPRREVAIFEALMLAQTRTLSKQALLDKIYGTGAEVDEQVVEVYVSRLRKRLKPFAIEIKVQRGLGYSMHYGGA
ncbi:MULTISPECIES: response regulator transcription factor [Pacificibacter]|uniref:response regulator transcription factor n=1 Tax=Pacificibacter TaxID=1042323 RepID=UPI001C08E4DA|nr:MULTISPECIES: response regulator transcription factor [Pacificibacter]MBU2936447.1 response regulator transcription factor [Pacificibacter marinus]MDO6616583.1 response regulator transcription factor [Pacificibacter sp. 1_MG-2023]